MRQDAAGVYWLLLLTAGIETLGQFLPKFLSICILKEQDIDFKKEKT